MVEWHTSTYVRLIIQWFLHLRNNSNVIFSHLQSCCWSLSANFCQQLIVCPILCLAQHEAMELRYYTCNVVVCCHNQFFVLCYNTFLLSSVSYHQDVQARRKSNRSGVLPALYTDDRPVWVKKKAKSDTTRPIKEYDKLAEDISTL